MFERELGAGKRQNGGNEGQKSCNHIFNKKLRKQS